MAIPGLYRDKSYSTLLEAQSDTTFQNNMTCFIGGVLHKKIDGNIFPVAVILLPLSGFPAIGSVDAIYVDITNNRFYTWDSVNSKYVDFNEILNIPARPLAGGDGFNTQIFQSTSSFFIANNVTIDKATGINYRTSFGKASIIKLDRSNGIPTFSISTAIEDDAGEVISWETIANISEEEAEFIGQKLIVSNISPFVVKRINSGSSDWTFETGVVVSGTDGFIVALYPDQTIKAFIEITTENTFTFDKIASLSGNPFGLSKTLRFGGVSSVSGYVALKIRWDSGTNETIVEFDDLATTPSEQSVYINQSAWTGNYNSILV